MVNRTEYKKAGTQGKNILAPSILAADFSKLSESVQKIKETSFVHVDIMDGTFVPNISFGPAVMNSIRKDTQQVFDVHMMVEEPIRYLADFQKAGADIICVHQEACRHLDRTLDAIHECGLRAGVALNPATALATVRWILEKVDMILIMSVNPGFGGQKFIPHMVQKVAELHDMLQQLGYRERIDIEVDGGVTQENVEQLLQAGANVIVAGSAVFRGDPQKNIADFKSKMGQI